MTSTEPSRLDRIEQILEATIRSQEATQQIVNSNAQQIEATQQIVDSNAQQLRTTQQIVDSNAQQLRTTQQIVDSNARAIEANSVAIAELRRSQSETLQEMRDNVRDVVGMVGTIAEEMQEIHSEIRGLQTENRRILERLEGHIEGGREQS
jgi:hypothetical protein